MKKIIYSVCLLSFCFSCNQPKSVEKDSTDNNLKDSIVDTQITKNESQITNKLSRDNLEKYFVNDNGWIQVKNALSSNQTGIYIYFQAPEDVARNLRLRIQYTEGNTYKFEIDGKEYIYKANKSKQTDNDRFVENSSINWFDEGVRRNDLKFLEALASSENAKLNVGGTVIIIDKQTKDNIQKTLDYFEAMDGLLPRSNMVNIRR